MSKKANIFCDNQYGILISAIRRLNLKNNKGNVYRLDVSGYQLTANTA